MIILENINKSFDKQLLKDFSFTFSPGKSYAIIGPSGCGKSTLLNIIGMLDKADSGILTINGIKNPVIGSKEGQKILKGEMSYMFQNYGLVDNETVLQNLKLVNTTKKDLLTISQILKKVGLENFEAKKIANLSGGEQQRVAIAKVLLKNSNIILADEPTGNLDDDTANGIMELLLNIHGTNKILIVVTHNIKYLNLFDEIIDLSNKSH